MNLIELQKILRAVEPAAVLVPPRVLESIVKQSWKLSGLYWTVPHRSSFIIDRQTLFRHVDQEDLVLGPDELLPATVMLLPFPSGEDLQAQASDALLLKFWQEVFHASVHLLLENLWSEGNLTQVDLRSRVADIGAAQFEEIKNVLVQDRCLPAEAGERQIYMEFAAKFLEEYYFSSSLLDGTFPGLLDKDAARMLLERDVNGAVLFQSTRLAGAAEPVVQNVTTSQEAHEFYYKLVADSEKASAAGNVVLAAIQRRRAARVAPPDLANKTMQAAQADMHNLAGRLQNALNLDDGRTTAWQEELFTLLDKADQGARPAEAAMLYDLEKVCLDNEKNIYALDAVEWLLSAGRRPIKRPLPRQRLVRLTRHLRSATQRLTMARLSETDRTRLASLLQTALEFCETRLREGFRPALVQAFEDVGLKPRNPPEKVAYDKMIEELIDRVVVSGFLTFSDLRDTLSRNLLKLPDLSGPEDFIFGDQLLRLDRLLATRLDGVYRRGEFYLRWLERFTALNFGTFQGRTLTLWFTLPFGAAFLLIEAIKLIGDLGLALSLLLTTVSTASDHQIVGGISKVEGNKVTMTLFQDGLFENRAVFLLGGGTTPLKKTQDNQRHFTVVKDVKVDKLKSDGQTPLRFIAGDPVEDGLENDMFSHEVRALAATNRDNQVTEILVVQPWAALPIMSPAYLAIWLLVSACMLVLLHSAKVRHGTKARLATFFGYAQFFLFRGPLLLVSGSGLKSFANSWSFQLIYWYVIKPLMLLIIIWPLLYSAFNPEHVWLGTILVICVSIFMVNSRPGQAMGNVIAYTLVRLLEQIRAGLLPRLFNFVVGLFKNVVHFAYAMLFHVDEWLCFREGDSQVSMVFRAVLTVIWFPISYLTRFNLVVFIEPFLNPLKLPVCTIAYKFYLPIFVIIQNTVLQDEFDKGHVLTWVVGSWVNFWFADVFGFFFWELKENWNLYRANRSASLQPISIGSHGETLPGLLEPGFHSGTVPKLYSRLRQAERHALQTGNWSGVRACQEELKDVAEKVRLFLTRDFVALLHQHPSWQGQGLSVGKVHLATNQIHVELLRNSHSSDRNVAERRAAQSLAAQNAAAGGNGAVVIEFESRSGWLLAGIGTPASLKELTPPQIEPLHNALVTLYKLAGVDLVREQLQSILPHEACPADLTQQGIFVRTGHAEGGRPTSVFYDLLTPAESIAPKLIDGQPADGWPTLNSRQILFHHVPVTWEECIRCWPQHGQIAGRDAKIEDSYLAREISVLPQDIDKLRYTRESPPSANGQNHGAKTDDPTRNGEPHKQPDAKEKNEPEKKQDE